MIFENKPSNWPINNREKQLDNICDSLEIFNKNPNYHNKECLLALLNQDDLNQVNETGRNRYSSYEVRLINYIYLFCKKINCIDGIMFLYRLLTRVFLQKKYEYIFKHNGNLDYDELVSKDAYVDGLYPPLKLFYTSYSFYKYENKSSYGQVLINLISNTIPSLSLYNSQFFLNYYTNLLCDLSCNVSPSIFELVNFTRDEIITLFKLESKISNIAKNDPLERRFRGAFCITISNMILKSRNNYNHDIIYKCIQKKDVYSAFKNREVWMRNTNKLNDSREGKLSKELLDNIIEWRKFNWMFFEDLPYGETYISSFAKQKPNDHMLKTYGDCWIGYKNDKIATSIAPVFYDIHKDEEGPTLGQVVSYDVIYDKEEFKREVNLLGKIIDEFDISLKDKNKLFNQVLVYWKYSIKDKDEWSIERERRYQVIFRENYKSHDVERDNDFLKIKSYLFICPDICYYPNEYKDEVINNKKIKLDIINRDYLLCNNCSFTDFNIFKYHDMMCPICGSKMEVIK